MLNSTLNLSVMINQNKTGFTIVELLIVVVVIAILASISVIAYTGVQKSARVSAIKADLINNSKALDLTLLDESNYPISSSAANNGQGLKTGDGNTIQYAYIAAENFYCMTITSDIAGIPAYRIDSLYKTIYEGPCKGQSAVSELPAISGSGALFAGTGEAGLINGSSSSAQFNGLAGVAADYQGNVYVADKANNIIRKITSDGTVSNFAGSGTAGSTNGAAGTARFNAPSDVAIGPLGNVYVADSANHRIRKITPEGVVSTFSGSGTAGSTNGVAGTARFNNPSGIAVDASGNVYVADTNGHRVRKIDTNGTASTLAGSGTAGTTNALGTAARFNSPSGIALDKDGNAYVVDRASHRIRKVTSEGQVTTFVGTTAGNVNGTGTAARFNGPTAVAVDASGNVYIADTGNNLIRKATPAGVVTTLSGSGTAGYNNGSAGASQYNAPTGVAISPLGQLYVGDTANNRVRKVE